MLDSSHNCASGCGGHVTPCPCPESGNPEIDSLEKVVNCFWQSHQDLAVERAFYESLESLASAIEEAGQALGDENLEYDQPDRISAQVLEEASQSLLQCEARLATCADFTAMYEIVKQAIGGLDGLTPALVYLTTLRVGLQAGVHPEKIFLETGAAEGAKALVEISTDQLLLSRDSLPRIFQHPELTTEDVQSCLTICKHQLHWLSSD